MGSAIPPYAYATLITRPSYLAGIVLLAHSLRKHGSKYPLVVLYTPNLIDSDAITALELESRYNNITLARIDPLLLPAGQKAKLIAARFADTWSKLRVFSEPLFGYSKVCYLDADMLILNKNMDQIFQEARLSNKFLVAANHICCCNLDNDSWAPADWTPENCAYTGLQHPKALNKPTPVPQAKGAKGTLKKMNGGMFVFSPSSKLWDDMIEYFTTCDHLSEFQFPDQDFLAEYFENKWVSLGWQWNALKTMRYWHPQIWQDEEVIALHYIVDKPWTKRIGEDETAGYKGMDGATHSWWWGEFGKWEEERKRMGEVDVTRIIGRYVAGIQGEGEESEGMRAIGSRVQDFACREKVERRNGSNDAVPNGCQAAVKDDTSKAGFQVDVKDTGDLDSSCAWKPFG